MGRCVHKCQGSVSGYVYVYVCVGGGGEVCMWFANACVYVCVCVCVCGGGRGSLCVGLCLWVCGCVSVKTHPLTAQFRTYPIIRLCSESKSDQLSQASNIITMSFTSPHSSSFSKFVWSSSSSSPVPSSPQTSSIKRICPKSDSLSLSQMESQNPIKEREENSLAKQPFPKPPTLSVNNAIKHSEQNL